MITEEFLSLRRQIIERDFGKLNNMQKKAVLSTEGPLLVLAGAGSGKTTVLVNRIANIIKYGNSYHSRECYCEPDESTLTLMRAYAQNGGEMPYELENCLRTGKVRPWEILAITFTNKAANELKDRLTAMLGPDANDIWASTFHSACVRILRRHAVSIGYTENFTIYDTDDSKRVIKDCLAALNMSDKILTPKAVLSAISRAKDTMLTPEDYIKQNYTDIYKRNIGSVYERYQKSLKSSDAMDFDDIIVNTVKLLQSKGEVRDYYQHKFKYVMVDEYQDTNYAQYMLTSLLAGGYNNICVVGDDDQSIYKFRGATIENILNFEQQYPNAKVIRLEQNYRSTGNILNAANAVIKNNENRKGKNLWTNNGQGDKISYYISDSAPDEGRYIADKVLMGIRDGAAYSDYAVLYRMNSQSNLIEQAFVRNGIPYRVIGGHKFYERKEIRDALAYLQVIANPADGVRLQRIINEPKRGIGTSSVTSIESIAQGLGISMFDVIKSADQFPMLSRSSKKLIEFGKLIDELICDAQSMSLYDLFNSVMERTGYIRSLELDAETYKDRTENLDELANNLKTYGEENPELGLNDFLQEVALMTDIDNYNADANAVIMMTVHAAKGLEFTNVFIAGMEETIFPSLMNGDGDIEEERRLAYVAITRAKKRLYITRAKTRMVFGSTKFNQASRFISEIPNELLETTGERQFSAFGHSTESTSSFGGGYYGNSPKKQHTQYTPSSSKQGFAQYSQKANAPASGVTYNPGDTVMHKAFGEGVVLSVKPMGNDTMLEIAFTSSGTKRIMANFAKVEKL